MPEDASTLSRPNETPDSGVPKIIWIMWLQGFDEMPLVTKRCYDSWKTLNPGWDLVFLDQTTVADYIDIAAVLKTDNRIEMQALSDIIRVNLLAKYGGVWTDATCFCCVPLDNWVNDAAASGFFAFDKPRKSRLMDAWFMASHKDCYLTTTLAEAANRYWLSNHKLKRHHRTFTSRALTLIEKDALTTRLWFSWPVRKLLKAYPYMWLPYLFTELLRKDARFRRIWDLTPKISADLPHTLQRKPMGLFEPLSAAAKDHIDGKKSPVYKLRWQFDQSRYTEATTLHYLLSQPPPDGATSLADVPDDV